MKFKVIEIKTNKVADLFEISKEKQFQSDSYRMRKASWITDEDGTLGIEYSDGVTNWLIPENRFRVEYIPEWVKITDDPKTWPEYMATVQIISKWDNSIMSAEYVRDGVGDKPWPIFQDNHGYTYIASHWLQLPQGPKEVME